MENIPKSQDTDLNFVPLALQERIIGPGKWQLAGFWPYTPLLGKSIEAGTELKGATQWMDANVPGCVQYDLWKAGIIADPYYEKNSLLCEWVSNRWWVYRCSFVPRKTHTGERCDLVFLGIDYKAHVYLNGIHLGDHEGMYRPATFDVTDYLRAGVDNLLYVVLEHAPDEMGQIGHTEATRTQKSRFGYKWDFGTRLVPLGLYGEVELRYHGRYAFDDISVDGRPTEHDGMISFTWNLDAAATDILNIRVGLDFQGNKLYDTTEHICLEMGINHVHRDIPVKSPHIWHPNGQGDQPLYNLVLETMDSNGIIDGKTFQIGIRTIAYEKNEGAGEESLPYTLVVNGRRTYVKGVNLVPLDHMYGSIPDAKYRETVRLMKEANVNLVRIWGGGLIEKELFYDLCDQSGILVWQDFIQSSSGLTNGPSTLPDFLELLGKTVEFVVKEKRNHTCIAIWCGGNELMDTAQVPVTCENPNIALLKRIVEKYDPMRLMLPTTASGPRQFLDPDMRGMNHDVHGPWKYGGTEAHYTLFNRSDSLMHSEFGVEGMNDLTTLESILSKENLHVTDMEENPIWRHHGEWWDTRERDSAIFGPITEFSAFIRCSRFIQAEGIRYGLEANRRRMFRNSGSILWQFNEPWPNVSCTSIVDYYNRPKPAYRALQMAYRPLHPSLKYDKLVYLPGDSFHSEIHVHNDAGGFDGSVRWAVRRADEDAVSEEMVREVIPFHIGGNCSEMVGRIEWIVPGLSQWFSVEIDLRIGDRVVSNRYVFLVRGKDGFCSPNACRGGWE